MNKVKRERLVLYAHPEGFVPGAGFRLVVVQEGGRGFSPTGEWPWDGKDHGKDMPGAQRPWFGGMTLEAAQAHADKLNRRLGIEPEVAEKIVDASIAASTKTRRKRERRAET